MSDAQDYLEKRNSEYSDEFRIIPKEKWPKNIRSNNVHKVLRSKDYLVQVYKESQGVDRLSVCRTMVDENGQWLQNISWEELQKIKNNLGYAHRDAVEVFPKESDVVNVANMRHLFVLNNNHELNFIWRSPRAH